MLTDIKDLPPLARETSNDQVNAENTKRSPRISESPRPFTPPPPPQSLSPRPAPPPPQSLSPRPAPPPPQSLSPRPAPPPIAKTAPIYSQTSPLSSPQVQSARHAASQQANQGKTHSDRRSFSDVIRSLTAKNKTPKS